MIIEVVQKVSIPVGLKANEGNVSLPAYSHPFQYDTTI
jgi:hypothetical protein